MAWCGEVWFGALRQVTAVELWLGWVRLVAVHSGMVWSGVAVEARLGKARRGKARHGLVWSVMVRNLKSRKEIKTWEWHFSQKATGSIRGVGESAIRRYLLMWRATL